MPSSFAYQAVPRQSLPQLFNQCQHVILSHHPIILVRHRAVPSDFAVVFVFARGFLLAGQRDLQRVTGIRPGSGSANRRRHSWQAPGPDWVRRTALPLLKQ